jgi:hypothetical protein
VRPAVACLDIVKKGYARDVESRQSSALVPAHRDRSLATPIVVGSGFVVRLALLAR